MTEVDQTSFLQQRINVREMRDGDLFDQVFVVRSVENKTTRSGKPYRVFRLGDRTGQVVAKAWEQFDRLKGLKTSDLVRVAGEYKVDEKWGDELDIKEENKKVWMRLATEDEYNIDDLIRGPREPLERLEKDLKAIVNSVKDPHLRPVLDAVFYGDGPVGQAFRLAPAAKRVHQAYQHGLLEHCTTVAHGVSLMAKVFGPLNRDLAVAGALLHDLGKLDVYSGDMFSVEMTNEGMLYGEIPVTFYKVRQLLETFEVPERLTLSLLHIICSHHGKAEHGATAVPSTREAVLVHMVDNLGGKLGSFDRVESEMAPDSEWSGFDRPLGTNVWVGGEKESDDAPEQPQGDTTGSGPGDPDGD